MASAPGTIVWDFDYSMISTNSDTAIPEALSPGASSRIASASAAGEQWTALMARTLRELHAAGATREAVTRAAGAMPVAPAAVSAIRAAHARGARQVIVSDANEVFISSFLDAHDLATCISAIVSNSASWDEAGCLVISPAHEPHGCRNCPINLCKGAALDALGIPPNSGRVFYVGDGRGDFCPSLRLRAGDVICAREGWPLHKALLQEEEDAIAVSRPSSVRARVEPWATWEALELLLLDA